MTTKSRLFFVAIFTRTRDFDGSKRLQVMSVLDPFFPNNRKIERQEIDWRLNGVLDLPTFRS